MTELDIPVLYMLTGLLITTTSRVSSLKTQDAHSNLIRHFDTMNHHLNALSRSIRSAHSDITARQLEQCNFMGAMSDSICDALNMDLSLKNREDLLNLLSSTRSPGKRSESTADTQTISKRQILLEDLLQKQNALANLKTMVDDAQSHILQERKRSCNLNLGFHCQTEQYSAIADMYNWLQSSLSPGKRRKRSTSNTLGSLLTRTQWYVTRMSEWSDMYTERNR